LFTKQKELANSYMLGMSQDQLTITLPASLSSPPN